MKDFFKMTLATVVGFLLVSMLSSIVSMAVFFALIMQSYDSPKAVLNDDSVLRLKLNGVLQERSEGDEYAAFMSAIGDYVDVLGLDKLRSALKKAAKEDKVKALYLQCEMLSGTPGQIEELREMLVKFKESGKPIYAYADQYTQGAYWLASVADEKWLNPSGQVLMTGMSSSTMFMKRALDKLGVEMQIFKVGTFKSAVEPYILTEMSDANREQMQQFNDVIWDKMKSDIGNDRIQEYADKGMFFGATTAALDYELVDSLVYKSDVKKLIEKRLGDDIDYVGYKTVNSAVEMPAGSTHKIAVLYASGAIDDGRGDGINSEKIARQLDKLRKDDDVKAVVYRIHSPGGSAFGSEQMWYAAEQLRKEKPLIVSMAGYAASGGYYMSCNADTIVAQHTTLTGSIGIFGMFPSVEGLVDKVGLDFDGVKTAEFADFGQTTRSMTEGERAILQRYIESGYELFTRRCAEGRGMDIDALKAVAEGRVWTGLDAKRIGLVDELGGLDRAIEIAAEKAGLANYKVKEYPKKKDFMTELIEKIYGGAEDRVMAKKLGVAAQYVPLYERMMNMTGAQALMPYVVGL